MELCTQFWILEAHESTTRLYSIVFTHKEILNHIFAKLEAQISSLSPLGSPGDHWPSERHAQLPIGLTHCSPVQTQRAKPLTHVWGHREATGELCCVVEELLWPDQDRRGGADWCTRTSVSPHLYSSLYFLLAYKKLFLQSVQLNIYCITVTNKYLLCYILVLVHWFHQHIPERQSKPFLTVVFFIVLQCNYCTVSFAKIGNIGVFSELQQRCSINYWCTVRLCGIVSLTHWSSLDRQICIVSYTATIVSMQY